MHVSHTSSQAPYPFLLSERISFCVTVPSLQIVLQGFMEIPSLRLPPIHNQQEFRQNLVEIKRMCACSILLCTCVIFYLYDILDIFVYIYIYVNIIWRGRERWEIVVRTKPQITTVSSPSLVLQDCDRLCTFSHQYTRTHAQKSTRTCGVSCALPPSCLLVPVLSKRVARNF